VCDWATGGDWTWGSFTVGDDGCPTDVDCYAT
jgi:hypothetical protein